MALRHVKPSGAPEAATPRQLVRAAREANGRWSYRGQAPPAPTGLGEVAQRSPRSRVAVGHCAATRSALDGGGARPEASSGQTPGLSSARSSQRDVLSPWYAHHMVRTGTSRRARPAYSWRGYPLPGALCCLDLPAGVLEEGWTGRPLDRAALAHN